MVLGLFLLLASIAYSDDAQQRREQEKERLFQIANEVEYKSFLERFPHIAKDPNLRREYESKENKAKDEFCMTFLKDLQDRKDMEFADPIIETDDYNDPKLQSYVGKCPKLELNKSVSLEPRWIKGKSDKEIEKLAEELGSYENAWVRHAYLDFRLYYQDFDNNPKNGREYLYYSGGWYSPALKQEGSGGEYKIINLNQCKITGSRGVAGPINYPSRQPTKNFNGILKYKGRYYIYDAGFYPDDGILLSLYKWDKKIKGHTIGACAFIKQKQTTRGAK